MKKIDFIIIGAQKSGTTSLHHYLNLHPDIYMSSPLKEPGYFMSFKFIQNYLAQREILISSKIELMDIYMLDSYKNEKLFGESSTYYTIGDWSREQDIPKRIYDHNPEVKLIYILRNPLDRIISNFLHAKDRNYTDTTLDEFLETSKLPLLTSSYNYQLKHFSQYFEKDQILILDYEKFIKYTSISMIEIFDFLNLSPIKFEDDKKVYNKSINREEFLEHELRFSRESFQKYYDRIISDIKKLEEQYNFSSSSWQLDLNKYLK